MKPKFSASLILFVLIAATLLYFVWEQASPKVSVSNTFDDPKYNWKTHTIPEIGLTFRAPADMKVSGMNPDGEGGTSFTVFVERAQYPDPTYYQLYGLYQFKSGGAATEADLVAFKEELDPATVREIKIDGDKAIDGQIKGVRNRYVTGILKKDEMFTLFTSEPTQENKKITDQILATFDFK